MGEDRQTFVRLIISEYFEVVFQDQIQLRAVGCFGHAEGLPVQVLQGCGVEHRLGLAELTQFWGEKTLIEREGKKKKEFLKVVNLEAYYHQ